jgi:hypothetical protein
MLIIIFDLRAVPSVVVKNDLLGSDSRCCRRMWIVYDGPPHFNVILHLPEITPFFVARIEVVALRYKLFAKISGTPECNIGVPQDAIAELPQLAESFEYSGLVLALVLLWRCAGPFMEGMLALEVDGCEYPLL